MPNLTRQFGLVSLRERMKAYVFAQIYLGGLVAVASLSLGLLTVTSPATQAAVFHCPTSTICVHADNNFRGARQDISGFAAYTDLNGHLHDKASS